MQIDVVPVRENPADWDALHKLYPTLLDKLNLAEFARHYVGITGGTPAMNTMMLLAAQTAVPEPVYLNLLRGSTIPVALAVGKRLNRAALRANLLSNLRNWDYRAALTLVEEHPEIISDTEQREYTVHLLQYAYLRLGFQFRDAAQALGRAVPLAPEGRARAAVQQLLVETAGLNTGDDEPASRRVTYDRLALREMVSAATIYHRRGQLLEFTGLVYPFREMALHLLALEQGVGVVQGKQGWMRLDPRWVDAQHGLREYLQKQKMADGTALRWEDAFTSQVATRLLNWMKKLPQHEGLQEPLKELNHLEPVAALRHKSPFGHGTLGVSEVELEKSYVGGSEAILKRMQWLAACLNGSGSTDPWTTINELVVGVLSGS